jgi:hypothetical protein
VVTKAKAAGTLEKAKELWTTRKRRHTDDSAGQGDSQSESQEGAMMSSIGNTPDISIKVDSEVYVFTAQLR